MSGANRIAPLAAGLAVTLYALAWRTYGIFDLGDEGVLLAQAWRVAHGQVPYVDFHTGYGPLYFRITGWLVALGGLVAVRTVLACLHGPAAALLYALARRMVGSGLAAVAVALGVAFFLPIAPRAGAPFNLPYPAWIAGAVGLGIALLVDRSRGVPGPSRIAFVGALAAVVALVKPNSGFLLAAGAGAALLLGDAEARRAGWVTTVGLALLALGVVVLVAPTGLTTAAWVLVPAVLALVVLGLERGVPNREAGWRLAALVLGFLPVAAAGFAAPLAALGWSRFTREVLLVGAGVPQLYALRFPWPAAAGAAIGLLAFVLPPGRSAERLLRLGAAATVVLAAIAGALGAPGLAVGLRRGAEEAAFALVPLALWGALVSLRRHRDVRLIGPTAVAVTAALQLYPRADFVHLMPVGALFLPLALLLWRDTMRLVPLPARMATAALVMVPLAAAAGRFAPTGTVLARLLTGRVVAVDVGGTRLVIDAGGAERLGALGATVAAVQQESRSGDSVFTFPACALVPFFAERLPAGPHDYFYPGRPDRTEVAALIERLAAERPRLAVTCTAAETELARAWGYHPELVAFLRARYRVLAERPPFTVRVLANP